MLMELLIVFIFLTIIFFMISVFEMENNPMVAVPFIMMGMLFSVLVTYGLWDVEYPYVGYNSTFGNSSFTMYSTMSYGDPYSYIFVLIFFIFILLFVSFGWKLWEDALETKGGLDYSRRGRR